MLTSTSFIGLQDGDVDLAIGADARSVLGMLPPGLCERVLFQEPLVCVVRLGHPILDGVDQLDLDRYLSLRHIQISTPGGPHSGAVDSLLSKQGSEREIVALVSSFVAALAIVAATDLAVTVSRGIALRLAAKLELAFIELPVALEGRPLMMTWHERFDQDPANKWLRAAVLRLSTALPG